tara:strand:- start:69 stop:764 length:696 start_codon:yes stop_codon:yes gene_type:complete
MADAFQGFDRSFFDFFTELAANNNREWFEANKPRYREEVVAPISRFIEAMAPRLAKISPHYVADPRPNGGSMFRIYRDVRFAKDKKPYKENAGVHFRHGLGRDAHAPGFYVHLTPTEVFFGGGIWLPPSPQLAKIREAIAADPKGWAKVIGDRKLREQCGGIRGDALKRPPRGYEKDAPHIEDIKRKTFFAMREATAKDAMARDFADQVASAFQASSPLMKFVCKAVEAPF